MEENKKYLFLISLIASLKLDGVIDDYLVDRETGSLSYDIGDTHFQTDIRMHVILDIPNDCGPLKIKAHRIILKNDVEDFIKKLIEGKANDKNSKLCGFIEDGNNLSQDGNCIVLDNAIVSGNAKIFDNAIVSENAWVYGEALVTNNARIFGNANVSGYADIQHDAQIFGNAQIYGRTTISDHAQIFGNAKVYTIYNTEGRGIPMLGSVAVYNDQQIFGNAKYCVLYESGPKFTRQFSEDKIYDSSNTSSLSLMTTLQVIRESIKSGGYGFAMALKSYMLKYGETGKYVNLMQQIGKEKLFYVEIPQEFCKEWPNPEISTARRQKIEYMILSRYFASRPKSIKQKLPRCFANTEKGFSHYASVCNLLYADEIYGKFNMFEEFICFVNVFSQEKLLNQKKWEGISKEQLKNVFNDFVNKYIEINNRGNDPAKAQLFEFLKNNYFSLEFIDLFNEFSMIVEENKDQLKDENAIEFEKFMLISKNARIFAPNGASFVSGTSLDGEYQILRRMPIKICEEKSAIAYANKDRDIFLTKDIKSPVSRAIATYAAKVAKRPEKKGKATFADNIDILSIIKDSSANKIQRGRE